MSKKKELYTESAWVRVAPKWQFWNRQEIKTLSCTKCNYQRDFRRTHHSAAAASMSVWGLKMALALHAEEHAPKKKTRK